MVGADGRHSTVAEAVDATAYDSDRSAASIRVLERPAVQGGDVVRHEAAFGVWPTNDDRTLVIAGPALARFNACRRDIESTFLATIDLDPVFAERLRRCEARRKDSSGHRRLVPAADRPWLDPRGDASYNVDFVTALGMGDSIPRRRAGRGGDREVLDVQATFDAMGAYQAERDRPVRSSGSSPRSSRRWSRHHRRSPRPSPASPAPARKGSLRACHGWSTREMFAPA